MEARDQQTCLVGAPGQCVNTSAGHEGRFPTRNSPTEPQLCAKPVVFPPCDDVFGDNSNPDRTIGVGDGGMCLSSTPTQCVNTVAVFGETFSMRKCLRGFTACDQ
jgi:hypothetical protein